MAHDRRAARSKAPAAVPPERGPRPVLQVCDRELAVHAAGRHEVSAHAARGDPHAAGVPRVLGRAREVQHLGSSTDARRGRQPGGLTPRMRAQHAQPTARACARLGRPARHVVPVLDAGAVHQVDVVRGGRPHEVAQLRVRRAVSALRAVTACSKAAPGRLRQRVGQRLEVLDGAPHALQVPAEAVVLPVLDAERTSADGERVGSRRRPCQVTPPDFCSTAPAVIQYAV